MVLWKMHFKIPSVNILVIFSIRGLNWGILREKSESVKIIGRLGFFPMCYIMLNRYMKLAIEGFNWFLGKNSLNQEVYNNLTGGCHDGIGEFSLNMNQGAESSISYLLARLSLQISKGSIAF